MSSFQFYYTDSEDESEHDKSVNLRIKRQRLRDASNPMELTDTVFKSYFRLPKEAFLYLLEIVIAKTTAAKRNVAVSPIIKLGATLRFFAEGSYQKGAGNDFNAGLAQPTFSKILEEILTIFENELCNRLIKFPDEAERQKVKLAFFDKFGFPGVIGCVDGTHVKIISPPQTEQHLYYNRKGYHSLNVMLVCDHEMRITYVDANNVGSSHDSFIWNYSALNNMLEGEFENGQRNTWILGDAGYPLKPYLITPFSSHDSNIRKRRFNELHTKSRINVERTIGVLKNTFRCLLGARQLHYKPAKATKIVNVCCALHNLRIKYKMENMEILDIQPEANENLIESIENDDTANAIRNNIMNSIL